MDWISRRSAGRPKLHHSSLGTNPISLGAKEVVSRLPPDELTELDRVAAIASGGIDLRAIRNVYDDARWRVPPSHPALASGGA